MFKNRPPGLSVTHSSAIIADLISTCTFKTVLTKSLSFDRSTGYIVKTIMRNTIKANNACAIKLNNDWLNKLHI